MYCCSTCVIIGILIVTTSTTAVMRIGRYKVSGYIVITATAAASVSIVNRIYDLVASKGLLLAPTADGTDLDADPHHRRRPASPQQKPASQAAATAAAASLPFARQCRA